MNSVKLEQAFLVREAHVDLLRDAVQQYKLPDENKALRIILDYVISEGNSEEIFGSKRCLHC